MLKRILLAMGAMLCLVAAPAVAQPGQFYVSGDVGYHPSDDAAAHVAGTDEHWDWSRGGNAAGFLKLGYGVAPNVRVELEGGYRPSNLNAIQADIFLPLSPVAAFVPAGGIHFSGVGGHLDTTTFMANALYDIPLDLPVQPFVGGGIGLAHTGIAAHGGFPFCAICERPAICYLVCSVNMKADDSSNNFAWQAIGGLSMPLAPQWSLDATYRYIRANGVSWRTEGGGVFFAPGRFRSVYSDSTMTLGVSYAFGGAEP
jgi:opacity protein-like surface antigen